MKTRVQLDFTDEQLAYLDKIKERLGAASRAEVVRRSLRLMDFTLDGRVWVRGEDAILRKLELF